MALWHFCVINYKTISYNKVPKCHWHFRGTFEMDMSKCPFLYNSLSVSFLYKNGHLHMSICSTRAHVYITRLISHNIVTTSPQHSHNFYYLYKSPTRPLQDPLRVFDGFSLTPTLARVCTIFCSVITYLTEG